MIPGYPDIVNPEFIVRFEGTGNYTLLYLETFAAARRVNLIMLSLMQGGKPLMVSKTLKYFEQQLPGFIRVSKAALINPLYMEKTVTTSSKAMQVVLLDGTRIVVSRRRIDHTLEQFALYRAAVAPVPPSRPPGS
ncbi:LytTR family DNA-binding domain-containing protein [Fibrella forsythiae]|uniref:LytTR family transcriptional regulator n=1 Tax=Fibrella forsythiae TaxID=2817061 RepID=A0ABS3JBX9_9BACT|nr:LytTR family DNA-binding domain-containing protein [Fibrella forsythiae]MBO0946966.1 LytTR family transcriptional regulator [Fibrella forsythiae]